LNSVARFLFFIVLSVALHLAGLFFDLPLLGRAHKPQSIEVSYISRSLGSFYPMTTRINPPPPPLKPSLARLEPGIISEKSISKGRVTKRMSVERENPSSDIVAGENNVSSSPPLILKDTMLPGRKRSDQVFSTDHKVVKNGPVIIGSSVFTGKHMPDALVPGQLAATGESKSAAAEKSSSTERIIMSQSVDEQLALSPVTEEKIVSWKISTDAIPRYDLNPVPHYPEVARLRSWEGKVVYEALILESGRVGHLNLLSSSGHRSLDNAARKAISHWQFKPAISSGRAIASQVEIPITFSLKDL